MILADTSVWIDHLRHGNPALMVALNADAVMTHPFIIGELACGTMKNRSEILAHLQQLPCCTVASQDEAMAFIERHRLMGKGLGYIDVHLLASALLEGNVSVLTRDTALIGAAQTLGISATAS